MTRADPVLSVSCSFLHFHLLFRVCVSFFLATVCFDIMDMDGNGALDQKELQMVLRALSMQLSEEDRVSVEHLQYVFEAMDVNADGRVTFDEFLVRSRLVVLSFSFLSGKLFVLL